MPPVDPIRPVQSPLIATNPAGQDPLGARDERRGGSGSGGGKKKGQDEAEGEAPASEEGPLLEGDALATRTPSNLAKSLDFGEGLPWEQGGKMAKRPKASLTGPLSSPKPLNRPAPPHPLPSAPPPRTTPPPQMGGGRRVDAAYDPSAALTHTLSALQKIGQKELPKEGDKEPLAELGPQGLAKPLAMLREKAAQAPSAAAPQAHSLTEEWLANQDSTIDLGFTEASPDQLSDAAHVHEAPKASSAAQGAKSTKNLPPLPQAEPPAAQAGPKKPLIPSRHKGTIVPASGEFQAARRASLAPAEHEAVVHDLGFDAKPKAKAKLNPTAPLKFAAEAPPNPAPKELASTQNAARKPAPLDGPPPAPQPTSDAAALMVRVVDLRSNAGLGGARLELEPIESDLLPSLPGQADAQGWWILPRVAPAWYHLTARYPGKVPSVKELHLVAGQLEDVALILASP